MKKGFYLLFVLLILFSTSCTIITEAKVDIEETQRERLSIDLGWKFSLGHAADKARDFDYGGGDQADATKSGDIAGPPHPDFDDGDWEIIDVPHDWCVGVEFDKSADSYHAYKKIGRDWPGNSIGWYRKTLNIPADDLGKRLSIEFDGVYRNCQVWLNGHPVWHNPSGYTSFGIDITDYVKYGEDNVIVVRVDATGYELWSYEGAGIYRHVWLVKTSPLHVARWGTYVESELNAAGENASARLTVETILENQRDIDAEFTLNSTIIDPQGMEVATAVTRE